MSVAKKVKVQEGHSGGGKHTQKKGENQREHSGNTIKNRGGDTKKSRWGQKSNGPGGRNGFLRNNQKLTISGVPHSGERGGEKCFASKKRDGYSKLRNLTFELPKDFGGRTGSGAGRIQGMLGGEGRSAWGGR